MKCPQCGYSDEVHASLLRSVMSQYVNDATGKPDCTLNSDEPYVELKGVKLRRADLPKGYKGAVAKDINVVVPVNETAPSGAATLVDTKQSQKKVELP